MRKRFGEIATFSRGLTFSKGDVVSESSKRVLRSNNIDLSIHSLVFDDIACLKEGFIIPDDKMLHRNDIFICMSNGSTQHLGKVAFISEEIGFAFGGFMGAIHPDESQIFPKYAFYACLSSEYRRFLSSIFNGININNLKWSDLSDFRIPTPPLAEQERIVAELDLLQGIIDKQKAQLKELDTLAQSIFYDMFGDPVENDRHWDTARLGSCCTSVSYGTSAPSSAEGEYVYLRMNNITYDGQLDLRDVKYISVSETDFEKYAVKEGDVLFNRTNSADLVGKTTWMHGHKPMIIAGYIIRVRLNERLLPGFVSAFMNTKEMKVVLKAMGKGAVNQSNINSKELQSILTPIPPLPLQQAFATKIEAIERQKASINASIAETQKLFDYTMDKYFG